MTKMEHYNESKPLFWEYDIEKIDFSKDRGLVIKKVLSHGGVEDLKRLRKIVGDEEIRAFIIKNRGRGMERRRLRFYQVIFRLPSKEVDLWLEDPARKIWDERCRS